MPHTHPPVGCGTVTQRMKSHGFAQEDVTLEVNIYPRTHARHKG